MKILNICMKYFGRYFIYFIVGLFTPTVVRSFMDADTWQYWVVMITTVLVLITYMLIRDWKYFKHEEWIRE
jgi:hypothetical protein